MWVVFFISTMYVGCYGSSWVVNVVHELGNGKQKICTGTIIASTQILTSGACAKNSAATSTSVESCDGKQTRKVTAFGGCDFYHPPQTLAKIGECIVLVLSEPLILSNSVIPVDYITPIWGEGMWAFKNREHAFAPTFPLFVWTCGAYWNAQWGFYGGRASTTTNPQVRVWFLDTKFLSEPKNLGSSIMFNGWGAKILLGVWSGLFDAKGVYFDSVVMPVKSPNPPFPRAQWTLSLCLRPKGKKCQFPFQWGGREWVTCHYYNSKTHRGSTAVCKDKRGKQVACTATDKVLRKDTCDSLGCYLPSCVFPFKIYNREFTECTKFLNTKKWCAMEANFRGKQWRYCEACDNNKVVPQYVSQISFIVSEKAGSSTVGVVRVNMNAGSGGPYIYPYVEYSTNRRKALTDFQFVQGYSPNIQCPAGFEKVNQDLNSGTVGTWNFLCVKRDTTAGVRAVTDVTFTSQWQAVAATTMNGFTVFPPNLNSGHPTNGKFVYLMYKKEK